MESQGDRVRIVRKHLRLNQGEFANGINVTQGAISQIENSGNASLDIILKISNTYKINLDWLAEGKGEMLAKKENIAPVADETQFWKNLALSQQKTIADLAEAVKNNREIFNWLQAGKPSN